MNRRRTTGFTLIELLVAIGVFSTVVTIATGSYLVMISLSRNAQAVAVASTSLTFSLENMMRTIRTGGAYSCAGAGDCSGLTSLSVTDAFGNIVTFSHVPPASGVNGYIQETIGGTQFKLTDPAVNITSLKFYLTGSADTSVFNFTQPFMVITATGSADAGKGQTFTFSVETGATMRGIDL